MTLKEALKKGIDILKDADIDTPAVDAGVMLCYATGFDKSYIYVHENDLIDDCKLEKYLDMLMKRYTRMPIQYITGHQEFMSLDFIVGPGVLIPRHDTETLVEAVTDFARQCDNHMEILDIGTGSGCIAVSLACFIKNSLITSVDISEKALEIANMNALKNGVTGKIRFVRSNLFDQLENCRFDIIISNPPYIRRKDIAVLQPEVGKFEPFESLDGGEDGLVFYSQIVGKASDYLKEHGLLAFEVGLGQAEAVAELLQFEYTDVNVLKDLSGIDRVVTGRLK